MGNSKNIIFWVILFVLMLALFNVFSNGGTTQSARDISYSEFLDMVDSDQVASVKLDGENVIVSTRDSRTLQTVQPRNADPLPELRAADVNIEVVPQEQSTFMATLSLWLPFLLLIGVWIFFMNRMQGGGKGGAMGFGKSKAKMLTEKSGKVTFDDVAGIDEAKEELEEIVEFLRDPQKFSRLGGKIPKGALLVGPPGTGKTLLARAIAGEAGVPFFTISGSDFVEMFVGVGASRVRTLFDEAKKAAPAIIFIDELDSVGRVRGAGLGGGHDEREQTLNQILAEMDGFEGHEAVVVLAATNRPDVLDPALLRPGRFDRHVTLELPDLKGREAILKVHCRDVPLAENVDMHQVAAGTPGFSGADLKNLVNEAAMAAARENLLKVESRHFDEMRDRIIMGAVRTLAIHPEERHRLAVHESGHTAVAYFLPGADPLHKVTIIPRGRALGGTHQLPEIERHTLTEEYLNDRLAVILGGRAAEQVFLGSVSSGADEDIRMATQIARSMVGRWGMSEDVGPVDVRESESHPFLGREMAQPRRFSDATAAAADAAVRRYLVEAEARAVKLLKENEPKVARLIRDLEERETLDRNEIAVCLGLKEVAGGTNDGAKPKGSPLTGETQGGH